MLGLVLKGNRQIAREKCKRDCVISNINLIFFGGFKMKKKMFVAMVFCMCMGAVLSTYAVGETVVVDDHFDDGDVATNTTGLGCKN